MSSFTRAAREHAGCFQMACHRAFPEIIEHRETLAAADAVQIAGATCPIREAMAPGQYPGDTRVDAPPPDELREELLYDCAGGTLYDGYALHDLSRLIRRIWRVTVSKPVKGQREAVAPEPQRGTLGDELVGAAEAQILEDREQEVVGIIG
jgi:hypothetical protein